MRPQQLELPIEKVTFDVDASQGQARAMDPKIVEEHRVQMMLNAPTKPFEPHLWEAAPGGPYIALTYQHTIRACQLIAEGKKQTEVLADWMRIVRAQVLRPETPLDVRKFVAGKSQAAQGVVAQVKMSRCAEILIEIDEETPQMSFLDKMKLMIIRAGQPRLQHAVCPVPLTLRNTCTQLELTLSHGCTILLIGTHYSVKSFARAKRNA